MCDGPFAGCAIGVCTSGDLDAAGRPRRSFSLGPTLGDVIVPTPPGITLPTGCGVMAAHGTCTTGWDSCDCNGAEICSILPANPTFTGGALNLPPAAAQGCVSAPLVGATPFVPIAACDTDGNACTIDGLCCERPGRGWCNDDERLRRNNPALAAQRRGVCGGGGPLDFWGAAPAPYPNGLVSAVSCVPFPSAPAPFNDPIYRARCPADGNPCTNDTLTCIAATGACIPPTATLAGSSGMASERIIGPDGFPQAVPQCNAPIPASYGCERMMCDGDADGVGPRVAACAPGARLSPTGAPMTFATDACTATQYHLTCEIPRCTTTAGTPGAPLNRAGCAFIGDIRLGADSSRCEFPQSCLGGGVCVPGSGFGPEALDLRAACQPPAGMCYLRGPLFNGVADGVCVPALTRADPSAGRSDCLLCQPGVDPFGFSSRPDGEGCDDDDGCTLNDRCSIGICLGTCDTSRPECMCTPA